jgi:cell division protein FtsW (lipid II flippase)
MLQNDHSVSYGLSVMGWLKTWFGIEPSKFIVVIMGAVLLMLPLIQMKRFSDGLFRRLYFAGILIWVIIFNHKAESSTFVIAVCGIAFWYYSQAPNKLFTTLAIIAFVFTCLSPTDLFPRFLRTAFVEPYVLKAVPCIFIWMMIEYQLLSGKYLERT